MKLKPLQWDNDLGETELTAFPIFGRYWLRREGVNWELRLDYAAGSEMYQTLLGTYSSATKGKFEAGRDYRRRMTHAVTGVEE